MLRSSLFEMPLFLVSVRSSNPSFGVGALCASRLVTLVMGAAVVEEAEATIVVN